MNLDHNFPIAIFYDIPLVKHIIPNNTYIQNSWQISNINGI